LSLIRVVLPACVCLLWSSAGLAQTAIRFVEPDDARGLSKAVVVTGESLIHSTQVLPRDTSLDAAGQIRDVMQSLATVIDVSGRRSEQVVKLNVYVADEYAAHAASAFLRSHFRDRRPAISFVTTRLLDPKALVAADGVAASDSTAENVVRLRDAGASGPARAAILPAGPRVYIAGQAEKGDGSLVDATRQTMVGLVKTLEHLGLSRRDVVQLKAFVTPMSESSVAVKEMIAAFPDETPPPIVLVEWESSLPIEIELVAASPARKDQLEVQPVEFLTPPWMKPSPVFCRVVRANHPATIFISGLYGATDKPDSAEEVRDLYVSLRRIAEASGSDMAHLAKATYYVSTDEVSGQLNTVRPEFYDPARPPSASKAKVSGTGRAGRTITLDMIAVTKGP